LIIEAYISVELRFLASNISDSVTSGSAAFNMGFGLGVK
jgi:hypothetical protein